MLRGGIGLREDGSWLPTSSTRPCPPVLQNRVDEKIKVKKKLLCHIYKPLQSYP